MRIHLGDCADVLATLEDNSIDSIATDPPAGISFMNLEWDGDKGGRDQWVAWFEGIMRECLRVLKPGGHALVWGLPRTSHWTAWAIESAGFEIRDKLAHLFGQGWPKSKNMAIMMDKAAGAMGHRGTEVKHQRGQEHMPAPQSVAAYVPITDDAKAWDGWGSGLKPSAEDWILARKPLGESTIAANVLKYGTGAMNIDATRVGGGSRPLLNGRAKVLSSAYGTMSGAVREGDTTQGRWPPNVLLSHSPDCRQVGLRRVKTGTAVKHRSGGKNFASDISKPTAPDQTFAGADGTEEIGAWECVPGCPVAEVDHQSGTLTSGAGTVTRSPRDRAGIMGNGLRGMTQPLHGDSGGASRFFPTFHYAAKPSTAQKSAGCDGFEDGNDHGTVKSVPLMRWLVRLVTPPGGVVLDPFMGSGTTGVACVHEQFSFEGIEMDPDHYAKARARIEHAQCQPVEEPSEGVPARPEKAQQTLF